MIKPKETRIILSILLIGAGFFASAQTAVGWDTLKSVDGVHISQKEAKCDLSMGYDQVWKLFRFENTNSYTVILIWDIEMHHNGACVTCNDPDGEYHRTLELQPGEVLEGECKIAEDERLHLFVKFNDSNYTGTPYELTHYELINLRVEPTN
jgi:hypothetical protein